MALAEPDANDSLQQLEEQYATACTALAQKKAGAEEPSKIQSRMQIVRDRLVGIANVIAERESALNALRAEIAIVQAEQSQRTQARMIVEEKNAVEQTVAGMEASLRDLNDAATRFANGLQFLRSRQYLSEANKHLAFDNAQSLERRLHGVRG